jgi:hypothetical protein
MLDEKSQISLKIPYAEGPCCTVGSKALTRCPPTKPSKSNRLAIPTSDAAFVT